MYKEFKNFMDVEGQKANIYIKDFEIHTTPLEVITTNTNTVIVELDDIHEKRYKLTACPYQGIRITTIDCVSSEDYYNEYCFRDGIYHRHILTVDESPWIDELKKNLTDKRATFLDHAKHFVLPLQEIDVEIVCSRLVIEEVK